MKHLLYTTIGYNREYCNLLELFLLSLSKFYKTNYTICILCDVDFLEMVEIITSKFSQFTYIFMSQSKAKSPEEASMNKLNIFDVPTIDEFTNILYVDLDCLFFVEPDVFLEQSLQDGVLYCAEDPAIAAHENPHTHCMWSLQNYTVEELAEFKTNAINPFNAGFFLFKNTQQMKQHFTNIRTMINEWKGTYFYEQGFLNVYFNKLHKYRNTALIQPNQYIMFPNLEQAYNNCILHFCGNAGVGKTKYIQMQAYWNRFAQSKLLKYLPNRKELIRRLITPESLVLEIGVFEGEFAESILEANPQALFLVDCWDLAGPTCMSGDADGNNVKVVNTSEAYKTVKEKFKDNPRVYVLRDFSQTIEYRFAESSLHLIYIDGDHSYEGVKRDLELYYPKLVSGGWLCGHDYEMYSVKAHHCYDFGVKQAVDEFCAKHNLMIEYKALDGCVSFAIQKP